MTTTTTLLFDEVAAGLARAVHGGGDLASCAPLMDRLRETGDCRWREVALWLVKMRLEFDGAAPARAAGYYAGGAEDDASDRELREWSRIDAWHNFKHRFFRKFELELAGLPDLAFVRALAADVDVPTIPADARWGGDQGEGEGPDAVFAQGGVTDEPPPFWPPTAPAGGGGELP